MTALRTQQKSATPGTLAGDWVNFSASPGRQKEKAWPEIIPVPDGSLWLPSAILSDLMWNSRELIRAGKLKPTGVEVVGGDKLACDRFRRVVNEFKGAHAGPTKEDPKPRPDYLRALEYYPRLSAESAELRVLQVPEDKFKIELAAIEVFSQPNVIRQIIRGGGMRVSAERPRLSLEAAAQRVPEVRAALTWCGLYVNRWSITLALEGVAPQIYRS